MAGFPHEFAPGDADTLAPAELQAQRRAATLAVLPPGTRLGDYEIVAPIGMGAMGAVFRARSLRVGHDVALKVLLGAASPESRARFGREARAAARLAGHPGIAAVHDQGETGGHVWLAMEYVPGTTLRELIEAERLSLGDTLDIVEQAARAVAHAHAQGVLHRDLKPGNILIDGGRAKVTDFGLAFLAGATLDAPRLTHPGSTLGTPAYMPREQAMAAPTDARADVYALGATLFHALAGVAPFDDASAEVVFQRLVAGERPDLARLRTSLPADVCAVVARAMAPAPEDRYPTAAALADDIARLRRGEPVSARPGRRLRALAEAVARRPGSVVAVLVALAALGALAPLLRRSGGESTAGLAHARAAAALIERARRATEVHVRLLQRAGPALRALEDHARGVRLAPDAVAGHLAAIDAAASADTGATPQAWRGLARVLAGADAEGHALLADATARAADDPFPALLQARAALAEWTEALGLPDLSYDERIDTGALVESPAMQAARARAQALVAQALRSPLWPAMTQAADLRAYADAVSALTASDPARAAAALGPLRDDPVLGAEAALLHGLARFLVGEFGAAAGDWRPLGARGWQGAGLWAGVAFGAAAVDAAATGTDADPFWEAGVAALDAVLRHHPRWLEARAKRAQLLQMRARDRREHGRDPGPVLAEARAAVDAVLAEAPAHLDALETRAQLTMLVAELARDSVEAARARARAVADYDAVLATDPERPTALINRGAARRHLAEHELAAGGDPTATLALALADLDHGLARRPRSLAARVARVQGWALRAQCEARRGVDPSPAFAAALAELDAAERLLGASAHLHAVRGQVGNALGNAAASRGGDAEGAFRDAIAALQAAVAAAPRRPSALIDLGLAWRSLARLPAVARRDGPAPLAHALAALDAALALDPGAPAARSNRCLVLLDLATAEADRGRDPEPLVERALADAEAAGAAAPRFASALANRGLCHSRLAALDGPRGRDPWPRLEQALADHVAALDLEPGNLEARNGLALILKERGALLAARRADPRAELARAIEEFTRVLDAQPDHLAARSNRGTARMDLAAAEVARRGDPRPHLAAARADFDAALARSPDYLPARLNRGSACQNEADVAAAHGDDPRPWLERALVDFIDVRERDSGYWRAWSASGWVLQRLGRLPEAADAYERSLALNPAQDFIREQLARVRAR